MPRGPEIKNLDRGCATAAAGTGTVAWFLSRKRRAPRGVHGGHPRSCFVFFVKCFRSAIVPWAKSRSCLRLGYKKDAPGWVWRPDRAIPRIPASGASATGPVGRWATSAPSHRADKPPGPQAPEKQARLVHSDRTGNSGRGARMRFPGASVLCCLSPPLIRSGQSHPGLYTRPHQPGSGRRVAALARSGHSAATEEPAPSVTLPRCRFGHGHRDIITSSIARRTI